MESALSRCEELSMLYDSMTDYQKAPVWIGAVVAALVRVGACALDSVTQMVDTMKRCVRAHTTNTTSTPLCRAPAAAPSSVCHLPLTPTPCLFVCACVCVCVCRYEMDRDPDYPSPKEEVDRVYGDFLAAVTSGAGTRS